MSVGAKLNESEIQRCLESVLANDIKGLKLEIQGSPDPGAGYGSDIIFVKVTGTDKNNTEKDYFLALKCWKKASTSSSITKEAFENEMLVYNKILPAFKDFQIEKGIDKVFDSVPKCYGTFSDESIDVIVLENLKKSNYALWNKKEPWTRENIDLTVREYGKLHAISVAFQEQRPQQFEEFSSQLFNGFGKVLTANNDSLGALENFVQQIYDLLKDDLDEHISDKWLNFKNQLRYIYTDLIQNIDGLKVIIHGDCWSNNFLLKATHDNAVAMLDWQITNFSSPVLDVSYFLFACMSTKDLNRLDDILNNYYDSFSSFLRELGSDPDLVYPQSQFLDDWKKYSKFGVATSLMPIHVSFVQVEDISDPVEAARSGRGVRNNAALKARVIDFVRYVVVNDLI